MTYNATAVPVRNNLVEAAKFFYDTLGEAQTQEAHPPYTVYPDIPICSRCLNS